MQHDAGIFVVRGIISEPAEVHRRLIQGEITLIESVSTDCGPGSTVGEKRYANLCCAGCNEFKLDAGVLFPLMSDGFNFVLHVDTAFQESTFQS